MEHTPRSNFKKITGLRLEWYGSGDWHFTTAYTRWLEEQYKKILEALIAIRKKEHLSEIGEMCADIAIEKATGKT